MSQTDAEISQQILDKLHQIGEKLAYVAGLLDAKVGALK